MNKASLYEMFDFFIPIVDTSFWLQQGSTNLKWDKEVRMLMAEGIEPTEIGKYTCKLGKHTIWIANYPYYYGHPYAHSHGFPESSMPMKMTTLRLRRYIESYKEYKKNKT